MKRTAGIAVFILIGAAIWCQTSTKPPVPSSPVRQNPLAPYAGTWTGNFEGHTWMTVKLAMEGDRVTGSIQHPREMKFNDQGEIKSVSDEQSTEVVKDAQLNNDGLLLTVKDADSQETNRFLMRLTGATTAEIKMLAMTMPPGMPKLKPWKLTRQGTVPSQPAR